MKWQKVFYFLGLLFLVVFEIGFLHELPFILKLVSPTMLYLIFLATRFKDDTALIYGILSGLIFDSFSGYPFGVFVIINIILVLVIKYLFYRFFTNLSLLVFLALGFLGGTINFCGLLFVKIFIDSKLGGLFDFPRLAQVTVAAIILNSVLCGAMFLIWQLSKLYFKRKRYIRAI